MPSQINKVRNYYNSTILDYKILWTGSDELAIHFGYWDDSVKTHAQSLLKMNAVMAKLVGVKNTNRVLDAGCGWGGTSIWFAKHIGCKVVGITIVPEQIKEARKQLKNHGITDGVSVQLEDYHKTTFADKSFDVYWAQESLVHAINREKVLNEAHRLLRKGGRIIIAEYHLRESPPLSKEEVRFLKPWLDGWAMPQLLTTSQYQNALSQAGFKEIVITDLTKYTTPSLRRLGKMSKLALPIARFFKKTKIFNSERFANVEASLVQYQALTQGLWRYKIITAVKK